ncbi:MAG: DUF3899 domain-containing protein [Bacilli bacterium]|nr:DUF3899 domain-containing protein [Bacilli bacterium]
MGKIKQHFTKFWKDYLIAFIIALICGIIIFLLFFLLKERTLYDALNAATMSAVITLCFGGLAFVASFGFFDLLGYGAKQTLGTIFSKKANKYNDYASYQQEKRVKREHSPHIFYSFLLVSILFLIVVLILEIKIRN